MTREATMTREQIERIRSDAQEIIKENARHHGDEGISLYPNEAIALCDMALHSLPTEGMPEEPVSIESYETDEWACAAGVLRFSAAMRAKLDKKRRAGRGGWNRPEECTIEYLRELLAEHVLKGDPLDIANLCMMIWNRENQVGK